MKKKILTTSLALALGLTLVVPTATAKADELDDLLNGATQIGGELDQNTGDLDKLGKKKTVIPAAKIEDIAKPNKKEDLGNIEDGYKTKEAAVAGAIEAIKSSSMDGGFYLVYEKDGRFYYLPAANEEDLNRAKEKFGIKTSESLIGKVDGKEKPSTPSSNKGDKKEDEKNKDNKDNKEDDKSKKDDDKSKKDDGKKKLENGNNKVENKANTNVKTGVGSVSAIVGLLSASIGGLFYTKKNK
ncbi:hypothetical protein HMPREF3224_00487 [Anaerococcus hydrogenalis]|nr:hypothetical protein HMPREF3224_00487 [Anaerococcus hydrogenalis]